MTRHLRVAIIAGSRHPIAQPFAGGMEAQTWLLASGLGERGHDVRVFAGPGSDPALGQMEILDHQPLELSDEARADVSMPPEAFMREHHAYQQLMLRLAADPTVDIVQQLVALPPRRDGRSAPLPRRDDPSHPAHTVAGVGFSRHRGLPFRRSVGAHRRALVPQAPDSPRDP